MLQLTSWVKKTESLVICSNYTHTLPLPKLHQPTHANYRFGDAFELWCTCTWHLRPPIRITVSSFANSCTGYEAVMATYMYVWGCVLSVMKAEIGTTTAVSIWTSTWHMHHVVRCCNQFLSPALTQTHSTSVEKQTPVLSEVGIFCVYVSFHDTEYCGIWDEHRNLEAVGVQYCAMNNCNEVGKRSGGWGGGAVVLWWCSSQGSVWPTLCTHTPLTSLWVTVSYK